MALKIIIKEQLDSHTVGVEWHCTKTFLTGRILVEPNATRSLIEQSCRRSRNEKAQAEGLKEYPGGFLLNEQWTVDE